MEQLPPARCPSCGSTAVDAISLMLIPARYYNCTKCVLTFRMPPMPDEPPDLQRFNDGWTLPPDKPKN